MKGVREFLEASTFLALVLLGVWLAQGCGDVEPRPEREGHVHEEVSEYCRSACEASGLELEEIRWGRFYDWECYCSAYPSDAAIR